MPIRIAVSPTDQHDGIEYSGSGWFSGLRFGYSRRMRTTEQILAASESAGQSDTFAIVMAVIAIVVISAVMIAAALVWSKHGLLPADSWTSVAVPEFVKRNMRAANREAGWGDGVPEESEQTNTSKPEPDDGSTELRAS